MYASEGSGLGHLRRLFLISEMLNRLNHETLIVSGHRAISIVKTDSIDFIKLPSIDLLLPERAIYWNINTNYKFSLKKLLDWRISLLQNIIDHFKPDILATDHNPFGRYGELKKIIERNSLEFILFLRGVLDKKEKAHDELSMYFEDTLMSKFRGIFICCDPEICNVIEEYPFLEPHKNIISYIGFVSPGHDVEKGKIIKEKNVLSFKEWCVVSNGGGKYYGEQNEEFFKFCRNYLPRTWKVDMVFGPYSRKAEELKYGETSNMFLHNHVTNLDIWHQNADILITSGGLNTILEAVSGNTKIIPIKNNFNSEINILCSRLNQKGLCSKPQEITQLKNINQIILNYPKQKLNIANCTTQTLSSAIENSLCE